jgi:hypothetical protein
MKVCGAPVGGTPNHDRAIDSMASSIAHELVEAVSDPDAIDNRAWEDNSGYENADKCKLLGLEVRWVMTHSF